MKNVWCLRATASAVLAVGSVTFAQTGDSPPPRAITLEKPSAELHNRVGVNYRFGWGIKADFRNLGGYDNPLLGRLAPADQHRQDREYDDGFVRLDSRGNNHNEFGDQPELENTTWYWGFVQPANRNQIADNQVMMSVSSSPAEAVSDGHKDDSSSGFEVYYDRELLRNGAWRFGVEGAFGFGAISINDGRTLYASRNVLFDRFSAAPGVVLLPEDNPQTPITGPGPLISDAPTRQELMIPDGAGITGSRRLEAGMYGFRLGPYVEIPLGRKWSVMVGGGLAVVCLDSEFSFNETVSLPETTANLTGFPNLVLPGLGPLDNPAGHSSTTDWLVGGYAAGSIIYALTDRLNAAAGLQWQNVGRSKQNAGAKQMVLDLSNMMMVTVGLSYAF